MKLNTTHNAMKPEIKTEMETRFIWDRTTWLLSEYIPKP